MGVAAASVLMSHQALQRDHGIVTQLLGCHQQHLPHRACGPLGTAHRWIGGFAPPHPRNAEGSCHSRGSTTAGSFRTEQVLLREMGNARTKSRTRNLYDGLRSYSKRRRTTHRKRHVMVGPRSPPAVSNGCQAAVPRTKPPQCVRV